MAGDDEANGRRPGIPLSAVLLATVAASLVTALVVSLVVESGEADEPAPQAVTLQQGDPGGGVPTGADPSGTAAPEFSFEALDVAGYRAGDDIDFAELRAGRPAVVNFFASWCAPCVQEMPDFEDVHREYGDVVAFVGLAERESAEDSLEIVASTGVTYDIGRDPGGDVLAAFQGLAMPTTVFIAADGTITSLHSGALSAGDLRRTVEAQLL